MKNLIIDIIIPAYNEEQSIGLVLKDIPKKWVREIIVCNNASQDDTAKIAIKNGATVLLASKKGYGSACLVGIEYLKNKKTPPDIVLFIDGDYSDYPEELSKIVKPILDDNVDLVIGARIKALREDGSMTPQQIFGNKLATFLMKLFFRSTFTDLGPFRAIKYEKLLEMEMEDKTYGWTIEMQLKALKNKMSYVEIPVHYKKRIGVSKVSGTIKGSIFAGVKILAWIFKYSLK